MKCVALVVLSCLFAWPADAADFSVEKTATGGASIKVNGQPFAEYVIDQGNKPYLWPIHGPTGKLMTRSFPMQKVESEPVDHPHHRGMTFGHEDIGGVNTWLEALSVENKPNRDELLQHLGRIRHREFKQLAGGEAGIVHAVSDWVDAQGKIVIAEERRLTFRLDGESRVIDVDMNLIGVEGSVNIEDRKDAGLSIRVPNSMCVDAKLGGTIVNSEGHRDADAWGKRAKWCDFNGPVEGEHLGIAMLNHPGSFRYPTPWHARTYALFTANPFGPNALDSAAPNGAFELKQGERLSLHHRVIFHKGDEKVAKIAEAFDTYAKEIPSLAPASLKP